MTPADRRRRRFDAVTGLIQRHVAALDAPAPELRDWLARAIAEPDGIDDDELDSVTNAALVYGQVYAIDAAGVPVLEAEVARLRRARSSDATAANISRADARADEARRLKAAGLTVAQIAVRMSPDPDHPVWPRTVYKWLSRRNP